MNDRISKAQTLIEVATDTFVDEVMAVLPPDKRYASAMTANALSIARRCLSHPDPADALLKAFGAKDVASLAAMFRASRLPKGPDKEVKEKLLAFLEAELAITNPRFLEQRKA